MIYRPLTIVAAFIFPKDAYSLCLTSKRFFEPAEGLQGKGDTPDTLIATKVLRAALLSNLNRVLKQSTAAISLDQFAEWPFKGNPEGSAVIAGLSMVQCVLGEDLNYKDVAIVRGDPFDYGKACKDGENLILKTTPESGSWFNILKSADLLGSTYRIQPLEGDPFPFDPRYNKLVYPSSFGLFVSTADCSSAHDLVQHMDYTMNVCKVSFDGKMFKIPDPHYTFSDRSKMDPLKLVLVNAFVSNFRAHPAS